MKLEILSTDSCFACDIDQITLPAIQGDMTVLVGHEHCIASLRNAIITINQDHRVLVYNCVANIERKVVQLYTEFFLDITGNIKSTISEHIVLLKKRMINASTAEYEKQLLQDKINFLLQMQK